MQERQWLRNRNISSIFSNHRLRRSRWPQSGGGQANKGRGIWTRKSQVRITQRRTTPFGSSLLAATIILENGVQCSPITREDKKMHVMQRLRTPTPLISFPTFDPRYISDTSTHISAVPAFPKGTQRGNRPASTRKTSPEHLNLLTLKACSIPKNKPLNFWRNSLTMSNQQYKENGVQIPGAFIHTCF